MENNQIENKKLLVTLVGWFGVSPMALHESTTTNDGKLIVSGPLQRADVRNQNGRIYPKDILVREAKQYYDTFVVEQRAYGELDHPESPIVNLKNVSHRIVDMYWKGNELIGKVEILPTPSGNILKELFKAGGKLGISSRGIGSVKEVNESLIVQDDFQFIAWDFVSNPSTHGAFMDNVNESTMLSESTSFLISNENKKYEKLNILIQELICELSCECNLR
jgi:hypothetical protein